MDNKIKSTVKDVDNFYKMYRDTRPLFSGNYNDLSLNKDYMKFQTVYNDRLTLSKEDFEEKYKNEIAEELKNKEIEYKMLDYSYKFMNRVINKEELEFFTDNFDKYFKFIKD